MKQTILNMNINDVKEYKSEEEFIKEGGNKLKLTTPEHRMTRPIYKYYTGYLYEEPEHTNKGWIIYVKDEIKMVKRII